MVGPEEVKLYFDYKSPFAYLAKDPAFALAERYAIHLRWTPFLLHIKAPGRIAKAEARARSRICAACGGPDRACGGGDDLSPGQIGFVAACPAAVVPGGPSCGAPIATLQDIVACLECVSDFKVHCAATVAVPGLAAYPTECNPSAPTTTTSTSSTTTLTSPPTTTTTTTSTTLPPCAPPPLVPLGSLLFTITAGTADCGGPALSPPPAPPFSGEVRNLDGSLRSPLGLGCLYFGGGGGNAFPPTRIPDGGQSVLDVAGISDLSLTLRGSAGTGPADCTLGPGAGRHCLNGADGTDGMGACASDADCDGGTAACAADPTCYFGPPVPVPAGGLSACILNALAADVCGAADLSNLTTNVTAALDARMYLTGDDASPCPRCVGGTCSAGARAGEPCGGGVGSAQTSLECPPHPAAFLGRLGATLALTTGTSTLSGPGANFCPAQRTLGGFGGEAGTVIEMGAPLSPTGLLTFSTTLAGTFCVPATESPLVNAVADLPGPGAVSVPGTVAVNLL